LLPYNLRFKGLISLILMLYVDRSAVFSFRSQEMPLTRLIGPQIYYIILKSLSLSLR